MELPPGGDAPLIYARTGRPGPAVLQILGAREIFSIERNDLEEPAFRAGGIRALHGELAGFSCPCRQLLAAKVDEIDTQVRQLRG